MKLLRLEANGFGPLRGAYHFDPARLTLLVDANERGKSSLLAAIVAALYGLDDDRRSHRVLTPRERWRPWDGGSYRVELELECRGERFTITRDFNRGTVAVWDDRGQERTFEFVDGKDEYPIGERLLGLDAEEFAKCAFLQHGELDHVVPDEEKARRASTLHARLENAADSRASDTNATETVQVLERALARYNCDYHGKTLQVDTAIKRLELKREFLDTEIRRFEHERAQLQAPLEALAARVDAEREARHRLDALDRERRKRLLDEARAALDEDDGRRADIEKHREELALLAPLAEIPVETEARYREAGTRHQEARAYLESFDARSQQASEARSEIEAAMAPLARFRPFDDAVADRLAARAQELHRLTDDDQRLRTRLDHELEQMVEHGFDAARIEELIERVGHLPVEEAAFLRAQPAAGRAFQAEQAELEKLEEEHEETLGAVSRVRRGLYTPGWILFVLGIGALLAGLFLTIRAPWSPLLVPAGLVASALGLALLSAGALAGGAKRRAARVALEDVEERSDKLRGRIAGNERKLAELARSLGYASASSMLSDWSEFGRLSEQHAPVLALREQVNASSLRLEHVLADVRPVLEQTGPGPIEPAAIDEVVAGIRQLERHRRSLDEWEKRWDELAEQEAAASEAAAARKAEALALIKVVGIGHDDSQTLEDHFAEVHARVEGAKRFRWLLDERVPGLERVLLSEADREALARRIEWAQSSGVFAAGTAHDESPRAMHEIEEEISRVNDEIRLRIKEQGDQRVEVERRERDYLAGHAAALGEREDVERALVRAVHFKRAVALAVETIKKVAADTHRRWADFLNFRVGELLQSMGAEVQQVRFGEDLDFAIKPRSGPQMSRGKAALQLSSGARDQLYLAVRLAIGEYLSRDGESMPLLLDDSFATSDDQRTRAAMRLLIERLARQHQMIVVTCHRARYEALAALDPELYAERVHWIDVGSAAPVPPEQMELDAAAAQGAEPENGDPRPDSVNTAPPATQVAEPSKAGATPGDPV